MRLNLPALGAFTVLLASVLAVPAALAEADRDYLPLGFVESHAAIAGTEGDRDSARAPAGAEIARAATAMPLRITADLDAEYLPLGFVDATAGAEAGDDAARVDPVALWIAALIDSLAPAKATAAERAALMEFYEDLGFHPLWVVEGRFSPAARALADTILRAGEEGLDAALYGVPALAREAPRPAMARDLAEAELRLSMAALAYARHARAGMVDPSALGPDITARPERPDPYLVLSGLAESGDPAGELHGYNPTHPDFAALRDKLALLRQGTPRQLKPRVPEGALIRPGARDSRVSVLRRRLEMPADGAPEARETYDDALVAAVREFQDRNGLVVDGIIGPATIQALNAARDVTIADLLVNMERWRWLPPDMGGRHYVLVNIPEYRLRVVTDGESVYETRVIVGTVERQTPIFSDEIRYIEVNPYWNVPRSIAGEDLLPELRQDPLSLHRRGIQVLYTGSGQSYEIDPRAVDWNAYSGADMPFRFRQVPGEVNALGRIKFMFPNEHAVYLHDTPSRALFDRSARMFSSGCVRVEDPVAFSEALMAFEDELDGRRVQQLIAAGHTRAVNLQQRVPVHLAYFTARVDEAGEVRLYSDIYGHDAGLKRALGLEAETLSSM